MVDGGSAAAAEAEQTAAAVEDDDVVLAELRDELCSVKSECEKLRAWKELWETVEWLRILPEATDAWASHFTTSHSESP